MDKRFTYQINPRRDDLGGGYQLKLMEGDQEVGGGVFPVTEDTTSDEAYLQASDAGEEWLGSRQIDSAPAPSAVPAQPTTDPFAGLPVFGMAKISVGHPSHFPGEFIRLSDARTALEYQLGAAPSQVAPTDDANTALDAIKNLSIQQVREVLAAYGFAVVAQVAQGEPLATNGDPVDDFHHWMQRRGPLGAGACHDRAFIAGHAYGRRAAQVAQTSEPVAWRAVLDEVERATKKFPTWPTDPLHAVAVLGEEFGELTKAVLQTAYEPHKVKDGELRAEAIQTAAMALRFVASVGQYDFIRSAQHVQGIAAPVAPQPQQAEAPGNARAAAARDALLFGTGMYRSNSDGSTEYIDVRGVNIVTAPNLEVEPLAAHHASAQEGGKA